MRNFSAKRSLYGKLQSHCVHLCHSNPALFVAVRLCSAAMLYIIVIILLEFMLNEMMGMGMSTAVAAVVSAVEGY